MAAAGELGEAEAPQPPGFSAAAFGDPELTEQAEAMEAALEAMQQAEAMQAEAMEAAEAMQQELEALANDPMLTETAEPRLLVTMSADSTQIER